jgi:hypothetical protein
MNSRYVWITFLSLAFVVLLALDVMAITYYSTASGRWSTISQNGPDCGTCAPNNSTDIIEVYHNITFTGSLDIGNNHYLRIYSGTLTVTGNLNFSNGSFITLAQGAGLRVNGNFENENNSDNVNLNGNVSIGGTFKNGTGGNTHTIIYLGPNATLDLQGGCSNNGQVIKTNPDGSTTPYTDCSGPLPVQLISFQAVQLGTDVQLTWATASEKGFQYFGIERANEELNWTEIGQVQGSGDSQVRIDYAYTDKALVTIGKTYYRLKAVDFDGYTEYFKVAFVDYRAPKAWAVTPNPAEDGHIVLTRNFSDDQVVIATVHSISGAQLFSEQISFVSNKHTFDTNLKPGMYVLTVKTGKETNHLRVVVE